MLLPKQKRKVMSASFYLKKQLMCVLCTGFIMRVHWTDKRAGVGDSTDAAMVGGEQLRAFRRGRLRRASLANKLLCHFGLKLEDWNGSKFLLSDRKGRQEIIEDLGELWPAAEKLIGRRLDPLDPVLIGKLKHQHESGEEIRS